jgi:CRISPR/Cas system type I-B associated protein Csh2 (Cas7 group RAMP superfamily)
MALFTEKPPVPLPPNIPRYDRDGRPLRVQVEYERRVLEYLQRMAAAIPATLTREVDDGQAPRRPP